MQLEETLPRIPQDYHEKGCVLAMPGADVPADEDLRLLRRSQPNVLLIGTPAAATALLPELLASCRQPVHEVSVGVGDPRPDAGTLLFRNITALSEAEQQILNDWLKDRSGIQVVSVAQAPVFPLVADGAFSAALFYRLNVVTLSADNL